MNNTDNNAACYTFEQLLQHTTIHKIVIPRIQRDYAQGRTDARTTRIRENFISALCTALTTEKKTINLDFVYGNIDKDCTLTLLDGQQRLTTLFLLHWYIAKKNKKSDIELLKKFSYEIRPSTRDFCEKLLPFNPFSTPEQDLSKKESKISYEITNQNWFPLSWNKDPSIASMLTMLDEIHNKFNNNQVTWEDLSRITFYLLPLKDMGLTDDLYIKMNSRGKPLTDFEHFKAELEKQLSLLNDISFADVANEIKKKFDTTWTDLLWEYRNSGKKTEQDTIVDDEFLRYIHFICDVISYKEGIIPDKHWNEFDLLENFFTVQENNNKEKVKEHFETLKKYFNCWCEENLCEIKCTTPDEFLSSFINKATNHEENKIITPYKNIFQECLANYTVNFNLPQFVFLYAVTYYLQHTEIGYDNFVRRIRIINNLIQNSDNEITPKRMKDILEQVEEILHTGNVVKKDNTFNKYQLAEEIHKLELLKKHSEFSDALFTMEDHKLLYGQLSILFDFEEEITQKDIKTTKQFIEQFEHTDNIIDCALMAVGDYSQIINYNWFHAHQFGTSDLNTWRFLFHQRNAEQFKKTKNIVLQLLKTIKDEKKDKKEIDTITILKNIINEFITNCEIQKHYPFNYYYIKYNNDFNPKNKNGKMYTFFEDEYTYIVLLGERINNSSYNPYLKAACHDVNDKIKISYTNEKCEVINFNTCNLTQTHISAIENYTHNTKEQYVYIIYYDDNKNTIKIPITINHDEKDGIDTENRIDKLKKYIELILEYEQKNQDAAGLKEYLETNFKE